MTHEADTGGTATMGLDELRSDLAAVGQEHLLTFAGELSDAERDALAGQIAAIDLGEIPGLVERYVLGGGDIALPTDLEPAEYFPRDPKNDAMPWDLESAREAGEALIAAGEVACFTVAGGQGSRLGYDGPKGCYPTSPINNKPLFQIFAEAIAASEQTYGAEIPWYIMTSPLNHAATEAFFREHAFFGLSPDRVRFIQQGTMPAFDKVTGKILLAGKGVIATSPDGHGGAMRALVTSGATAQLRREGVKHISYWQVDNPNVNVVDPVFLGLHAAGAGSSGEMSSKMLPKVDPAEKVGVFCRSGGRTVVIEYSDLPAELAEQRDEHGGLRFLAGSIAIHAISVDFVDRVVSDPAMSLPFHRAVKKVAHVDLGSGELVTPDQPNAVKVERFIFDAIPMAAGSIVYETDRVEEFAPVKNAEGTDSIVTSKQLQTERAARWLEAAGVEVPRAEDGTPDCVLEISPLSALNPHQLAVSQGLPKSIERGSSVVI